MPACLNVSPLRVRTGLRKIHRGSSALKWRETETLPWALVGDLPAAPTLPLSPPNLVLHFPPPKHSGLIGRCPKVCVFLLPDDAESGSGQGRKRKQQPQGRRDQDIVALEIQPSHLSI